MKTKLFTAFFCSTLATACIPQTDKQTTGAPQAPTVASSSPSSNEGGIDGGGGGTLPANPIDVYRVHQIIFEAKEDLIPYFKGQSRLNHLVSRSAADQKFFGPHPALYDVMMATNIEILDDKPCTDANGVEVDGSIHASQPNTICISAYRIAPKLIEERARIEIIALISHELSHLLGGDEKEARELQKSVAFDLGASYAGTSPSSKEFLRLAVERGGALSSALSNLALDWDKLPDADRKAQSEKLTLLDLQFETSAVGIPYSLFVGEERDAYQYFSARLNLVGAYLAAKSDPGLKAELDQQFNNQDQISFGDYEKARGLGSPHYPANIFASEKIERIKSDDEAKMELRSVLEFYLNATWVAQSISFDTRPNPLRMPSNAVSPFTPFLGSYDVTRQNCTGFDSPEFQFTKFEIKPGGPTGRDLELIGYFNEGFMSLGGLYDGGSTSLGGAANLVRGDADSATRDTEMGDRWGDRQLHGYHLRSFTISKTPSGFKMTRTDYFRSSRGYGPFKDETRQCVFDLQRKSFLR